VIRAILFDKDGTLLDFEATWTPVLKRLALEAAGGDARRAAALLKAGGYISATGRFGAGSVIAAGTNAELVELWYPELSGERLDRAIAATNRAFHDHGERHAVIIDGVRGALANLAADGWVMGVATNDATAAAKATLAAVGLGAYLPHVIGYDAVVNAKPAPDMVLAFAALADVRVGEVAVVGDNVHDMAMARAAGAGQVVGVLSGNSSEADLAPVADAVLPSVRDLPAWLHQNRK